jgi:hypothetical protein
MNGWVEYYRDGSFKNLCLKVERASGLLPGELWLAFNDMFDYLPIAAVRLSSFLWAFSLGCHTTCVSGHSRLHICGSWRLAPPLNLGSLARRCLRATLRVLPQYSHLS